MSFGFFGVIFSIFLKFSVFANPQAEVPGWVFAPEFAFRLPEGWKVLGRSEKKGIGFEIFAGLDGRTNARFFYSGHDLPLSEFLARMQQVVSSERAKALQAEVVPFGKEGMRLHLEKRTRYKGTETFEVISPLAVGGKGLDVHIVAPWKDREKAKLWHAELMSSLRLYWMSDAMPNGHGVDPAKASD
jgi:hypothetical protein